MSELPALPSILIVEDDAPLRNAVCVKLSAAGYEVLEATNGSEGLDIALEKHPSLIFLDIAMPGVNGLEMLTTLREDSWGARAKVIMLTNSDDTSFVAEAAEKSILGYVVKSETTLAKVVELAEQYSAMNH